MIRINLKKDPFWIDLIEGVRIYVKPPSSALIMGARAFNRSDDDGEFTLLNRLALASIIEWEGVGDDEGNPAPVTPQYITALMSEMPIAVAFMNKYLLPALNQQRLLEKEKNG